MHGTPDARQKYCSNDLNHRLVSHGLCNRAKQLRPPPPDLRPAAARIDPDALRVAVLAALQPRDEV
eukprot:5845654-Alexandrium_andersonii.AAC.1